MKYGNIIASMLFVTAIDAFAADVLLEKADFTSAKEVMNGKQILIDATLNESGIKKLNPDQDKIVAEINNQ